MATYTVATMEGVAPYLEARNVPVIGATGASAAEMLAARNAGAEVVVTVMDAQSMIRVIRSAQRQGWKPIFSATHNPNSASFRATDADLEGTLAASTTVPYTTSPRLAPYREAMQRYQPGAPLGGYGASAWAHTMLLDRLLSVWARPQPTEPGCRRCALRAAQRDDRGAHRPDHLLAHVMAQRPLEGPTAVSVAERVLTLMVKGGLDDDHAAAALVTLLNFTLGASLYRLSRALPDDERRQRRFTAISAKSAPIAYRLRGRLAGAAVSDGHFADGLTRLIDSYATRAAAPARPKRTRRTA